MLAIFVFCIKNWDYQRYQMCMKHEFKYRSVIVIFKIRKFWFSLKVCFWSPTFRICLLSSELYLRWIGMLYNRANIKFLFWMLYFARALSKCKHFHLSQESNSNVWKYSKMLAEYRSIVAYWIYAVAQSI